MGNRTWILTCNVWGWKIQSNRTRPIQGDAWWSVHTPGGSRTGTAPHRGQTPTKREQIQITRKFNFNNISLSLSASFSNSFLTALFFSSLSLSLTLSLGHPSLFLFNSSLSSLFLSPHPLTLPKRYFRYVWSSSTIHTYNIENFSIHLTRTCISYFSLCFCVPIFSSVSFAPNFHSLPCIALYLTRSQYYSHHCFPTVSYQCLIDEQHNKGDKVESEEDGDLDCTGRCQLPPGDGVSFSHQN